MKFYRYEAVQYASLDMNGEFYSSSIPNPQLNLIELNLFKETAKGYWIGYGNSSGLKSGARWVSKTSKKRYAYPTKKEAIENYIMRFKKRIKILEYQLWYCKISLSLPERELITQSF